MKLIEERIGFVDAANPDLSRFKVKAGKLVLYQGWRDSTVTSEGTIWYCDAVLGTMGKKQEGWLRLFLALGLEHRAGGPGRDAFDSLGILEK